MYIPSVIVIMHCKKERVILTKFGHLKLTCHYSLKAMVNLGNIYYQY